ncbi:NADH-quinone oxidoreductase subunit NuoE, partial [candidate division KSB1 bacterium]|nr:NADH-quinone oxidoreductase subunit NuoE [candidate division KSB1 bacterium]NIR70760.1 NADH-quinone oxidoreductase subunit NuoE [candidate division KSB1 bacterium]NIS23213.1 NADH-quinone oxidoreductase subunit NuoE [candidate division KSB1 bacterium]NIT70073.1 NADH-quinone oxidoreductase subunit NuoE [candidate division KSB1 bacterium]NIU23710.1 NADH-quinone oxidoreductase subunit NuoE [candidate division KSB1 bacterium]
KIVQRHRKWISDDSIKDIADYLDMSPDQLDSVATFYNLIFRKPVGENIILMCDSVSCWIRGFEALRVQIRDRLGIDMGETSENQQFTLLPIQCLGTCDHAPAIMINEELYRDLDESKLDQILSDYQSGNAGNGKTAD